VVIDFAEAGFRYELQAKLDELQPTPQRDPAPHVTA
jgi:hypothetical protein